MLLKKQKTLTLDLLILKKYDYQETKFFFPALAQSFILLLRRKNPDTIKPQVVFFWCGDQKWATATDGNWWENKAWYCRMKINVLNKGAALTAALAAA